VLIKRGRSCKGGSEKKKASSIAEKLGAVLTIKEEQGGGRGKKTIKSRIGQREFGQQPGVEDAF